MRVSKRNLPFQGLIFRFQGNWRGVYCISLVSPSISSDFACRNHLSCPIIAKVTSRFRVVGDTLWKKTILYTSPPKTKKSHPKGTIPKVNKSSSNHWILRGFQIEVRELGVASLQTFCCSCLGSQGLSPVYAFVNSNPPGFRRAATKAWKSNPGGGEKTGQHLVWGLCRAKAAVLFFWDVWTCGYQKQTNLVYHRMVPCLLWP